MHLQDFLSVDIQIYTESSYFLMYMSDAYCLMKQLRRRQNQLSKIVSKICQSKKHATSNVKISNLNLQFNHTGKYKSPIEQEDKREPSITKNVEFSLKSF
ncbi:hypothetical protein ABFS83_14G293500 [Erythranthe nasuta]